MHRKIFGFIFFILFLLCNSAEAMKRPRQECAEEPLMAITELSKDDWHRLERQQKKIKLDCTECGYRAKKGQQIVNHIELHYQLRNDRYKNIIVCGKCNFLCNSAARFKRHENSHSKSKLYFCTVCKRGLKYKDSLQRHVKKIHDQES